MPSIPESIDDALFPDLPPPPPLMSTSENSNNADSASLHVPLPDTPASQPSKPRAKRTNWVAIGMEHLKNNSIFALVKASPSHPITAEFVRRHMQVDFQTYETPNPAPKTSGAWFSHIGKYVGDKSNPISGLEICSILHQLCSSFSFDAVAVVAGKKFIGRCNPLFSGLLTNSEIHFTLAPITLPTVAYITPNDHYRFNSIPKRLASFRAYLNIDSLKARPTITLSSCLAGLFNAEYSKYNAEYMERSLSKFLYITSFICHHVYACVNAIDDFAHLQKEINDYKDANVYSPYSAALQALNFLSSMHCPDLNVSDFKGCKYFTPITVRHNGLRIGSEALYSNHALLTGSQDGEDEVDEEDEEDEEADNDDILEDMQDTED